MIIKNPQYAIIGQDVSDTTATPADVLAPKEFHQADGQKVQGTIPTYAGSKIVTPSENTQTLATENKYVNGHIVVNPIPSNYKDTTGTDATASDILSGKKAVTGAGMIIGNYVPPFIVVERDVNFYDYDGTLVMSYSAADFANLSTMPANPTHTGLVAEGWNWTLADAKTYVAAHEKLNIGQMYHTASGKNEFDVEASDVFGKSITLGLSGTEKDWGDGTVDTQTSHTYTNVGSYTIKLSGTTLPNLQYCNIVTEIRVASGVTTFPTMTNNDYLRTVTMPNTITSIAIGGFYYLRSLKAIIFPSGLTSLGNYVFYSCYSLRTVSFAKETTTIGEYCFAFCISLQSATLPDGITELKIQMFNNTGLIEIVIPNTVTTIGSQAFYNCQCLKNLIIPSGVTTIQNSALYISGLFTMVVLATTPPTLGNDNIPPGISKIFIPNGTLAAYQAATNWSNASSKFVELPA